MHSISSDIPKNLARITSITQQEPGMSTASLRPDAQLEDAAEEAKEAKKPTLLQSWEKLLKEVARYDDDMVKNWKEDIDTLLVFAGLFSAVVTAFTIESYRWLAEDPADITVALLTQISRQLNASQTITQDLPLFQPERASIRINCFWFLSLIFSLTSGLFGLLCKQWLREHQRDTPTRTPGEALALRQLRRDSFEKWGVSSFLSALPILLEVALLLFFVGVLELLWSLHSIPFAVCLVAVMLSAGLYFFTTLLPTLKVPRDQMNDIRDHFFGKLSYQLICPYKSPQSWGIYQLSRSLIRPLLRLGFAKNVVQKHFRALCDHVESPTSDWSSFDLQVVRQFDQGVPLGLSTDALELKLYELRAFEWVFTMFRDSPSMIPHLQNVFGTIHPSVAASVIFGRWDITLWHHVSVSDIEFGLKFGRIPYLHPDLTDLTWHGAPTPAMSDPFLQHSEGINLLFCHQYWMAMTRRGNLGMFMNELFDLERANLQQSIGLRFVIPFPVVDLLWKHEDPVVRRQSLQSLRFFEEAWKICAGYDEERHDWERIVFVAVLAKHMNDPDCISELLTSKQGQAFIRFIHKELIIRRLYHHRFMIFTPEWHQAIQRTQKVGNLPFDYFLPLPEDWPHNPSLPVSYPIQHSSETVPSIKSNDEMMEILIGNASERFSPLNGDRFHDLKSSGIHKSDGNSIPVAQQRWSLGQWTGEDLGMQSVVEQFEMENTVVDAALGHFGDVVVSMESTHEGYTEDTEDNCTNGHRRDLTEKEVSTEEE
ncbi:hypothetical protein Moror_15177 [Moniliophthora roreri MCA 2997]|uniref:DUF6535 domain-containing protein n=2 Tax=Moniliophthora roreri TaxID=221103 RepID=V2Y527_MONRO|nr:hypothetical protein Moror_15177 [Moniliophthora roreri MCA 2997]KAI3607522.1 hypothetical protein WG66_005088 [Moniliophthora roreri]